MIANYDSLSSMIEAKCGPQGLVSWYLMASLMYYHFDSPLLSDGRFDQVAKTLHAAWGDIEHRHKHLITLEDLAAGTLLLDLERYPIQARTAAYRLQNDAGVVFGRGDYDRLFFEYVGYPKPAVKPPEPVAIQARSRVRAVAPPPAIVARTRVRAV